MDVSKLQEAVNEVEAEVAKWQRLAEDLKAAIQRSMNGGGQKDVVQIKPHLKSFRKKKKGTYLSLAIEVLREQKQPTHIEAIREKVEENRGKPTTRASVEAALIRGMKAGKWQGVIKRTNPGTYSITQ